MPKDITASCPTSTVPAWRAMVRSSDMAQRAVCSGGVPGVVAGRKMTRVSTLSVGRLMAATSSQPSDLILADSKDRLTLSMTSQAQSGCGFCRGTSRAWAWYISAMPRGTRWETTARATVAPLASETGMETVAGAEGAAAWAAFQNVAAAKALKENGAKRVIVAATHAVFSHPASERLVDESIDSVLVTNTLPITPDKEFPTLTVLSIAPLIAKAITAVFGDDSVTSLFPGQS